MTSLIQGILHTRNINLARIAASEELDDPNETNESSKYRRLQRFFVDFEMPLEDISRLIRRKIPIPAQGYTLSMDRANWQFGKNILTSSPLALTLALSVFP